MNLAAVLRADMGIMTMEEVAALLDVSENTLAQWRAEKKGPDFVRLGRNVFYRKTDVVQWVDRNVVRVEVQTSTAA